MGLRRTVFGENYYSSPYKINDLRASEIYGVAIRLNFTIPEGNFEKFNVYVNDALYDEIYYSGDTIVLMDPLTTYDIRITPVGVVQGELDKSNRIIVTTLENNYSQSYHPRYEERLDYAIAHKIQIPNESQRSIDNQRVTELVNEGLLDEFDFLYYFKNNYPNIKATSCFYTLNWVDPTKYRLNNPDKLKEPRYYTNQGYKATAEEREFFQNGFVPNIDANKFLVDDYCLIYKTFDFEISSSFTNIHVFGNYESSSNNLMVSRSSGNLTVLESVPSIDRFDLNEMFFVFGDQNGKRIYMNNVLEYSGSRLDFSNGDHEILPLGVYATNVNVKIGPNGNLGWELVGIGKNLENKRTELYNIFNS
ncbi:hypothetical protein [Zunongwangia sp. HGR-M22]|uniref:hypothetical protein n=1 Tax=Zunongwangia sp. HGR-M22 TaxID=3015168 RepID=UPI0022DD893F|nr:hypothetical protein [Zunongwangia sp. HGR-M22]WBL25118.1 hypothetical protein PBT91_14590 [Zunongwangia sp. HGR-M22]